MIRCPSYRSYWDFYKVIGARGGGWYPAGAMESKDELVMAIFDRSKIKVFRRTQNE
jgi:hypothetical protein